MNAGATRARGRTSQQLLVLLVVLSNWILALSTSPIQPDVQEQTEASPTVLTSGSPLHPSVWTQHTGLHSTAPGTRSNHSCCQQASPPLSSREDLVGRKQRVFSPPVFHLLSAPCFSAFSTQQSHIPSWSRLKNGGVCVPWHVSAHPRKQVSVPLLMAWPEGTSADRWELCCPVAVSSCCWLKCSPRSSSARDIHHD